MLIVLFIIYTYTLSAFELLRSLYASMRSICSFVRLSVAKIRIQKRDFLKN